MIFALYLVSSCCVVFAPPVRQAQNYTTMQACGAAGETWIKTFPISVRTTKVFICWPEKP